MFDATRIRFGMLRLHRHTPNRYNFLIVGNSSNGDCSSLPNIVVVRYVAQRMELISIGIWDDTLIIHTLNRLFNCIFIFDRIDSFFTDFDAIEKPHFVMKYHRIH